MNFKKVFLAVVIAMGITGLTATADAGNVNSDVKVLINGELLAGEKQPVIVNDRTLVPFRAIGETMGCEVSWDDKTRTAFLTVMN